MSVHTIRLELLRTGPEHNQLLSPLTPYLAVCGNRPAETIYLSHEHIDVIERLDRVRYNEGRAASEYDLQLAAEPVLRLLGSIRGFREELSFARRDEAGIILVRLILSAQELALLPFELAFGPNAPGPRSAASIVIPPHVVLSRETRRESPPIDYWPDHPKILVVAADPRGQGLPMRAHMLALRRALHPWLDRRAPSAATADQKAIVDELSAMVTVCDNASVEAVAKLCASNAFTHVHVLCHGALSSGREPRFGLAMHDSFNPSITSWVDAERFASAILSGVRTTRERAPSVLTLCVCDSSNVATVVRPNASVAHELHAGGVPLVVASQLPLTFEGSTVLTETFYQSIFKGEAPSRALAEVRAKLARSLPHTHDWAALTVYSSLPATEEETVRAARVEALKQQIEVPLVQLDRFGLRDGADAVALDEQSRSLLDDDSFRSVLARATAEANKVGVTTAIRYVSSYKRAAALGIAYRGDLRQRPRFSEPDDDGRLALLAEAVRIADSIFARTRSAWSATQFAALSFAKTVCAARNADQSDRDLLGQRARLALALVEAEELMLDRSITLLSLDNRPVARSDLHEFRTQLWVLAALYEESKDDSSNATEPRALHQFIARLKGDNAESVKRRAYFLMRELHRYHGWWLGHAERVKWPGADEAIRRAELALKALYDAGVEPKYLPLQKSIR